MHKLRAWGKTAVWGPRPRSKGSGWPRQRLRPRHAHPCTRTPRTRPGLWARVRVRASPTRRAAHLAPPRPLWRAATSYSSGSACSRIPSSPSSPWLASRFGAAAATAAIVRGARPWARGPGLPGSPAAQWRGGGGMRVLLGEEAHRLLPLPLSLSPLPPGIAQPARHPARAVVLRGGRARLLPLPLLSAATRPTSEEGGRSGGPTEAGGCVRGAPGVPQSRRGKAPSAPAGTGGASPGTWSAPWPSARVAIARPPPPRVRSWNLGFLRPLIQRGRSHCPALPPSLSLSPPPPPALPLVALGERAALESLERL